MGSIKETLLAPPIKEQKSLEISIGSESTEEEWVLTIDGFVPGTTEKAISFFKSIRI